MADHAIEMLEISQELLDAIAAGGGTRIDTNGDGGDSRGTMDPNGWV